MIERVIHAVLDNRAAVLIYNGYVHDRSTWREIPPGDIAQNATIMDVRTYALQFPGLKLPGYAMAA